MDEISVVRKFRTTGADGKNCNIVHYDLDMSISLSYREEEISDCGCIYGWKNEDRQKTCRRYFSELYECL